MDGELGTYGGEERCIQVIGGRNCVNRPCGIPSRRLENNIGWFLRKWDGDMAWIDLAQGRDRWRSLMNTVMNLPFP